MQPFVHITVGFMATRSSLRGFTLLEMSIVLVIIALLAGAVFAGKSALRAAQIRDMMGQYDATLQAVKEFQDKYHALPGDMVGAAAIWGTDTAGCPGTTNMVVKTGTCDGDGNGHIGDSTVSGVLSATTEWFRAWQQLADAGFFPGSYTGVKGASTNETTPGVNVPAGQLKDSSMVINYLLNTTTSTSLWGDQYGHVLGIGSYDATTAYPDGPVLTSLEAVDADGKIDDGLPGTGKVRAWRPTVLPGCTTDLAQATSTYAVGTGTSDQTCSLIFLMGF